ncbi:MAG: tRNA (adenosine(37)-N6)-threonylcarbamoyltransferase complex ATPase subunit type 1 TsaE [Planctomycetaceae bacterium]|nr:tRNA (adenosine(37)-N6)-threonylcarbamoyltransferase complex ATPase subunit type 1 TsaE [Planctomycetaceae bacterium]
MISTTIEISNLSATDRLGRLLAESLPNGSVVALIGTLGAGKTTLVQAIAKYVCAEDIVASPTFVLLHEYTTGSRPIYHFDAYRLESEAEFRCLSPDDYFEDTGLTFIEWADKFPAILPAHHLEIRIELFGSSQRQVHITGFGSEYEAVIRLISGAEKIQWNTIENTDMATPTRFTNRRKFFH